MSKETLEEDATSYELAESLFKETYGYDPQIIEGNQQHELIVAALQKGIVYGANLQGKKTYSEKKQENKKALLKAMHEAHKNNKNNKGFVPYPLALRLKQLGFDEPCFAFYQEEYTEIKPTMVDDDEEYRLTGYRTCKNTEIPEHYTAAPTYSQAFKWFRDNYKLHHNIVYLKFKKQYLAETEGTAIYFDETEYDEAELDCLEKLIIIVENNKEK